MKKLLQYLYAGNVLSVEQAKIALTDIASGNQNDAQVAAFLSVYNMRMPLSDELIGFRQAMLDLAIPVSFGKKRILDIVGTGGDGKDTFNISTLACFVCAGAGINVAKHGNYGVSSISGSSNVLEAVGIKFTNDVSALHHQLDTANITFLHAPLFHPAMKHVSNVRKQLQVKTIFNLLGPLVNPCLPSSQVIGVYSGAIGKLYKKVLSDTKINFAIVHSIDGYDEISLTNDTSIHTRKKDYLITPFGFGFERITPEKIYGGDSLASNAKIFTDILQGKGTDEQNNVVIANAGLAISIHENMDLETGLFKATESLQSGKANDCLLKLQSIK